MVQNAAYYIFTQADDGSFEAYPVDSQYRFTPVINYRTLTADEAEEEFSLRNKTINYFSLMVKKRLTDAEEKHAEEEITIPKVKSKVDKLVRYYKTVDTMDKNHCNATFRLACLSSSLLV